MDILEKARDRFRRDLESGRFDELLEGLEKDAGAARLLLRRRLAPASAEALGNIVGRASRRIGTRSSLVSSVERRTAAAIGRGGGSARRPRLLRTRAGSAASPVAAPAAAAAAPVAAAPTAAQAAVTDPIRAAKELARQKVAEAKSGIKVSKVEAKARRIAEKSEQKIRNIQSGKTWFGRWMDRRAAAAAEREAAEAAGGRLPKWVLPAAAIGAPVAAGTAFMLGRGSVPRPEYR